MQAWRSLPKQRVVANIISIMLLSQSDLCFSRGADGRGGLWVSQNSHCGTTATVGLCCVCHHLQ
eukprot:scaffold15939_cov437-Ochromonas_danica.AAC.1